MTETVAAVDGDVSMTSDPTLPNWELLLGQSPSEASFGDGKNDDGETDSGQASVRATAHSHGSLVGANSGSRTGSHGAVEETQPTLTIQVSEVFV